MPNINDAIQQAQDQAGAIVDAEVTEVTLPASSGGQTLPMQKPSMATIKTSGGISSKVDDWLKVNEDGLKVGTEKGLIDAGDSILVEINMTEDEGFLVKQSVKWGKAPVQYASTYDGVLSDKGMSWEQQMIKVNAIEPGAKMFPSADIIMTVAKPIKLREKTIAVGTQLGHTLSMSNWRNWEVFYNECAQAGLVGDTIKVNVIADPVEGKNGYTWGVLKFELPKQ